ncbi:hypothetical protein ACIRRH_41160 [Kitasatospora sp. NPDC101235]|uniref:hypothetical protein n=1 Tax=Kitasatospora sp. NPDC101235 TaxID=3364101 RepID=UPI0037F2DAE6
MNSYLEDARAQHVEALTAWRERRAEALKIEDPNQRAAALKTLQGERPAHPLVDGISLTAIGRGNRRLLAPLKTRHANAKAEHAEALGAWRERRAKALEIKDPEQRAAALEEIGRAKPTSPVLVATGAAVVATVVVWPMLHGHRAAIVSGALTLWVLVALVLGQTTPEQQPPAEKAEEDTSKAGDQEPDGEAEEEPDETLPTPAETHALTASLATGGTSVLLTRLAADLGAAHPLWKASTKAIRALLAQASIPVREGVRTPDGNGPGVHHEDVPPLPSPSRTAPLADVVANVGAGQSANTNTNNTEEWSTQEGRVMRADPENPARTIIVSRAPAA